MFLLPCWRPDTNKSLICKDIMATSSSNNPNYDRVYPNICYWAKEELKSSLVRDADKLSGVDLITGLLEYAGENVYLSGGLLSMLVSNPDLNKIMTDPQLLKSDIDLYILGTVAEKKFAVDRIIQYLNLNRDCSRNEIKLIGWTGSVIYIVTDYEPRIIQLILMDEVYQTMDHVINEFDLDYVALYYNGVHNRLVISARCAKAIYTKVTGYKPTRNALSKVIYRGMKAVVRGYTINPESTRQMIITAYDVGKDIPEGEINEDYPLNALDADIIKVEDGAVTTDKITYKFQPGFIWDIMYLRYYTHCWNYMNKDYLRYNDVIQNPEYIDESGKLDINMLKYYYKTEYSIKNIWLGSTLPDEAKITEVDPGMKQIFWRGMNNIGYYICQTGKLIKKPSYENCEKLGPQLLDNPDLLDKIMPVSRFKEGNEHSFGGHHIYMPFHDTKPIVVNGIFGKMETGGTTITISFILSPNSRDYIFALQRQLQRYININVNMDPALKHTGLQKIIKLPKKAPHKFNKAKYGFTDTPDEKPATSIAPYTLLINVADMAIAQFLKKYPVNTGKSVNLCLDFTCYLRCYVNYRNVNTEIRYKYKLHPHQPFIKGDAGTCQPNSGLIIREDFDILRKHITGPHMLYDLTGAIAGNADCNIKPLDLSAIPELVSNSMVRFDRYFLNMWGLIKDDTLINADRPNTTYNLAMDIITNTVSQDMAPDTSLIIEFKQPPISINHGNYYDYARRLMPTYINRISSNQAEKDRLTKLMKHIGQSSTENYSSGLLGELTDESYAKVQAFFKAINPTGYGSELYEELYGIYNCHDLYPGKKNLMYLKVELMNNTIYNGVPGAELSGGKFREFFHHQLRTKFVVKIRTYPIHIDVSKLMGLEKIHKYVNHTIAHLYLFNVNLPCIYIDMTNAYNKVPQTTIDYLDDNKIWLSMMSGVPNITNSFLDSRVITKETVMTCDYMNVVLVTLITGIKRIYPAYCPIDFVLDISADCTNLPDGVIPKSTKLYTISVYIDKLTFTKTEVLTKYFRDTGYTFRNHININYAGRYITEYAKHTQSALEYLGVADICAHYDHYAKQLVAGLSDELPPELIEQIELYVFRRDSIRLHIRESLA